MFKVLLICAGLVSYVAATCLQCPEALTDDTQTPFCATNSYGQRNVTQSQLSNWNCLHPENEYTVVSSTPCAKPPANTCGPNNCGLAGPTVCGELDSPNSILKAFTVSVFANLCQLIYYDCVWPAKSHTNLGHKLSCMSPGYIQQVDNE